MERIPTETPPTEKRKPLPDGVKTLLWVLFAVVAAVIVGTTLQDLAADRLLAGALLLVCALYLLVLGSRRF